MDHILPCHWVSLVLRSHLFPLHQIIEFLQVGLKLGDKQIERHMLVHNRSLLNKEVGESAADEESHTVECFDRLFPQYKEHTVQYLLLRAHVWCHISESAFENVFDAAPDFVDIRHRLFGRLHVRVCSSLFG